MFTWSTYKIYMAHILHFDKNLRGKKSNFLVMTQSKKELQVVKETGFFCPVVIKGLMSTLNEKTTISEEVLGILEDFKELNVDELPNNLYPMRDKGMKVKIFNVGDDMMVFLRKKRFLVPTTSFSNVSMTRSKWLERSMIMLIW